MINARTITVYYVIHVKNQIAVLNRVSKMCCLLFDLNLGSAVNFSSCFR